MKNMYKLISLVITALLSVTLLPASGGMPSLPSPRGTTYVLYPPTNLHITNIESCAVLLQWEKPQNGGNTPPGLIGYNIYRDGVLLYYDSNPDSLNYYDFINDVGSFTDSVTAYYDLTTYGYPGQHGESSAASAAFSPSCGSVLPLWEPWDQDSFAYQQWTFVPSQGNWMINADTGDPIPTASFKGAPVLANYDYTLQSTPLVAIPYTCANIYASFDSRVVVNNPTSEEKLIIETEYDKTWHPVDSLVNDSSTGWVHHLINLTGTAGKAIKLGFRAKGVNSANIGEWDIDNILVKAVCISPSNLTVSHSGNHNYLTWDQACSGSKMNPVRTEGSIFTGYNIYRTCSDSLPPFCKLGTIPNIEDTTFDDLLASGTPPAYCYYVTANYEDSLNPGVTLCESPSDTACTSSSVGLSEKEDAGIRIFPDPFTDVITIDSDEPYTGIELLNFTGVSVYSDSFSVTTYKRVPLTSLPSGNYLLRIQTDKGMIQKKLLKFQ
jgi:hypothetical protein